MQSGSDRMLKRMRRRYTRDDYLACVERLRSAMPGLVLTTDIIVGFPGETDADFDDTERLVLEVGFDEAFTFKFSPRDGTPATRLPQPVPDAVAGDRLQRVIATVRRGSRARNAALVGTTLEVLVEGPARRGELLQARTRTNKVVLLEGSLELVGTYLDARLTGTTGATVTGVPTASSARRELATWP
jgi:tRNA-2-methylthio-N6-dimethylallyladenosine synthase